MDLSVSLCVYERWYQMSENGNVEILKQPCCGLVTASYSA